MDKYKEMLLFCQQKFTEEDFRNLEQVLELFEKNPFTDLKYQGIVVDCTCSPWENEGVEEVIVLIYNDNFEIRMKHSRGVDGLFGLDSYDLDILKNNKSDMGIKCPGPESLPEIDSKCGDFNLNTPLFEVTVKDNKLYYSNELFGDVIYEEGGEIKVKHHISGVVHTFFKA